MELWKTNAYGESSYGNTETSGIDINIYAHTLHNLIVININSYSVK